MSIVTETCCAACETPTTARKLTSKGLCPACLQSARQERQQRIDDALRDFQDGLTLRQAADKHGIAYGSLRDRQRRAGVVVSGDLQRRQARMARCTVCDRPALHKDLSRKGGVCRDCRDRRRQEHVDLLHRAAQDYMTSSLSRAATAKKFGFKKPVFDRFLDAQGYTLTTEQYAAKMRGRTITEETRRKIGESRRKTATAYAFMPLPISKKCNGPCGRTLPGGEDGMFYVRRGQAVHPETGERSRYLDSYCKECSVERVRIYRGNLTDEERQAQDKAKYDRFIAKHGRAEINEYKRFMKQKAREEQGIQRAWGKGKLGRQGEGIVTDPKVPLFAVQAWVLERSAHYAAIDGFEALTAQDRTPGLVGLAKRCHVDQRRLYAIVEGSDYPEGVPLKTVDTMLVNEASTELWEVWDGPLVGQEGFEQYVYDTLLAPYLTVVTPLTLAA
jgi:hypothetical protein